MPWPAKVEMGQGSLAIGPTHPYRLHRLFGAALAEMQLGGWAKSRQSGICRESDHPMRPRVRAIQSLVKTRAIACRSRHSRRVFPRRIRWACCAAWKHFDSSLFPRPRLGSASRRHPRPSPLPLARPASGCLAALDAHRGGQAQSRRHGRGEAQRLPLALLRRPGFSRREQTSSRSCSSSVPTAFTTRRTKFAT